MKIIIAAGGTGGHVNPALAVANKIKELNNDADIMFVGTKDKIESRVVPAAGFKFETINISGFQRKLTFENIIRNIKTVFRIFSSSIQARRIIKKFKPDVVVGFGGYVSGPVLREATKLKIPTAIHEQNAFPGITNKTLAKKVDKVMLTTESAKKYLTCKNPIIVTGLPVREEMLNVDKDVARMKLNIDTDKPLILSMGGSLGAKTINESMCNLIAQKVQGDDCTFLHAMGQYGLWVPDKLKELGVDISKSKNVIIREYINDMQICMPAADIVICRAGASSVCEIEALGKASILIPSPNVAENHQFHNAMTLVENDAAILIEEKDLTGDKLLEEVNRLLKDKQLIPKFQKNAKELAFLNATLNISNIIIELSQK